MRYERSGIHDLFAGRMCVCACVSLGFISSVFFLLHWANLQFDRIRHISLMGYVGIFIVCYFILAAVRNEACGAANLDFNAGNRFKTGPTPTAPTKAVTLITTFHYYWPS